MKEPPMRAQVGVSPIAWSNDDLPELGVSTTPDILHDAHEAGYEGVESGGKFPTTSEELRPLLKQNELELVSGWYGGKLLDDELSAEKDRVETKLTLFRSLGAACLVYGEVAGTIQNKLCAPVATRRRIPRDEFPAYGRKVTAFAEYCQERGVPLSFHHHMGTVIESEGDIDLLMANTGPAVGLLFDAGHLVLAGGDPLRVIEKHANRINHVHAKDVRRDVLARVERHRDSFLAAVLNGVFTVPGDGDLDFRGMVQRLASIGYQGWFVVEAEQNPRKAPPLKYARIGYHALTGILKASGYNLGPVGSKG